MQKQNLADLLSNSLYRIPDYQRGYAWDTPQWKDFAEDVDALIDEKIRNHYTGTIVTFKPTNETPQSYGTRKLVCEDVVDGQQRLTTSILYLSIILNQLTDLGLSEYEEDKANYLYKRSNTRLTLNNDTQQIFSELIKDGRPNIQPQSRHQQRLADAYSFFSKHLNGIPTDIKAQRLAALYDAITSKLVFTLYEIEEECEIGMTFELMNSRGKGLSTLEMLKNYFMHWVYRNLQEQPDEAADLTKLINQQWKTAYVNIGSVDGEEDQVLRAAWIFMCSPEPKNWSGYQGFKEPPYFPIRKFIQTKTTMEAVKVKMEVFVDLLATASNHYAAIKNPTNSRALNGDECKWLKKLNNGGNLANFLPLIIAARMGCVSGKITKESYVELLQTLETFLYRVFMFEGKRSNAGKSRLYRMGHEVYLDPSKLEQFTKELHGIINRYSPHQDFIEQLKEPGAWYAWSRLLKYTLYEYELKLLRTGVEPKLTWQEISNSTLEHILPQQPEQGSQWLKDWKPEEIEKYQHDIGNMCLTYDNSRYQNFEFARKRGQAGSGYCYAHSDIQQEREIANYPEWTAESVQKRRAELISWIQERWAKKQTAPDISPDIETEDEDITEE